MNSKRNPKCHLLTDWKEQIVHIGDEQVSLQNQFDNLRNDFSDNSPRLDALETGVNSLDGRLIITESDIVANTNRITANENDIDRIDAELVNKTGDINALANRMSLAEADIDDIDARLVGIETGEILYSQLSMDADKDFEGKAIINPGLVDGVDIGSHAHTGGSGGAKINLKDVEVTEDKDFGTTSIASKRVKTNAGTGQYETDHYLLNTGGVKRWSIGLYGVESDSPKGSNLAIHCTDNNGNYISTPLRINRENGRTELTSLQVWGNIGTDGVVDGVDVSEHVHDGTAIGGKKVNLANVEVTADKDFGGIRLTNVHSVSGLKVGISGSTASIRPDVTDGMLILGSGASNDQMLALTGDVLQPGYAIPVDLGADVYGRKFRNGYFSGEVKANKFNGATINTTKTAEWDGKLDRVPTIPSDTIRHSHDSISGLNGSKIHKTITFTENGPTRARITYEVKGTHDTYTSYAEVRKNDVRIGTRFEGKGTTYQTITQDLTLDIKAGDKIQLWASTSNELNTTYVKNLRIKYDIGYSSTVNS